MRAAVLCVFLLVACGPGAAMPDAAANDATSPADAGVDAASALDASLGCAPAPTALGHAIAIAGSGTETIAAISPSPIDGSFEVAGGYDGDAFDAAAVTNGFHVDVALGASGLVLGTSRTYASDAPGAIRAAFVDTHGAITIGGWIDGPTTVERTSVDATAGAHTGLVARLVPGLSPAIATISAAGADVVVTATSRRGDGYFVGGDFRGAITIGGTTCTADAADVFVAAYTFEGAVDWVRCFGGPTDQHLQDIAMHDAGDAYVVGTFDGMIDIGDGVMHAGSDDAFIARFGGNGAPLWVSTLGGATAADALVSVVASADRVIAVGTLGASPVAPGDVPIGGTDGVVVSVAVLDGRDMHTIRVGTAADEGLASIAVDRCGRAWIAGTSEGYGSVLTIDAITLEAGPDLLTTGGNGLVPTAVAVTQDGAHVLIGGTYTGAHTIAGATLAAPVSGTDAFLLSL
jgi:hypothetical protein